MRITSSALRWSMMYLTACAANAHAKGIEWLHSAAEGQATARRTGRPVLIDFYTDWCGWCKKLDKDTYSDSNVQAYARRNFVCVKVDGDEDRDTARYFKVTGYPTTVICKADGKVLLRQSGYMGPEDFLKLLKRGVSRFGTIRPPKQAKRIADMLKDARRAMENKQYNQALAMFRAILKEKGKWEEKTAAEQAVKQIEEQGKESLTEATAQIEAKNWPKAIEKLRYVMEQFRGLDPAKAAAEKLAALRADPNVRESLRQAEAQLQLKQARDELASGRADNALGRLEALVKSHPQTKAAQEATGLVDKIRSDKKLMRKINDAVARRQCQIWLNLAASFELNNQRDRARHYLQRVITTFPDTSFAARARKNLAKMDRSGRPGT